MRHIYTIFEFDVSLHKDTNWDSRSGKGYQDNFLSLILYDLICQHSYCIGNRLRLLPGSYGFETNSSHYSQYVQQFTADHRFHYSDSYRTRCIQLGQTDRRFTGIYRCVPCDTKQSERRSKRYKIKSKRWKIDLSTFYFLFYTFYLTHF